eukprot:CAMPEP_0206029216 /NCGR_PEP_ID=MMETSP1464-20131121/46343_1 /ASSEMBLY_ACC=CAM_ASM_001124 /TAXON_ID=119497 /ORGANISM="Exanthemachrysis gayraliae, Strain RCC1523" /LENGTH=250 /DNA_ID=CAMNT_0053403293 /DNA_START=35 /DNA_END=787 /DNA_ORIENTATION=+
MEQIRLMNDLYKFAGGALFLEFFYSEQVERLQAALDAGGGEEEAIVEAVLEAVCHNGWSREYNESLVDLIRVAHEHGITIHALDDPEWSRDAFEAKHGRFRGGLKYLANRATLLDDGRGATSRWVRKVMAVQDEREAHRPVLVLGGAEHGPVMVKLLAERGVTMHVMYEDFGDVQQRAHRKMSIQLEETFAFRKANEEDVDNDEEKIQAGLAFFLEESEHLQADLKNLRKLAARRYPSLARGESKENEVA